MTPDIRDPEVAWAIQHLGLEPLQAIRHVEQRRHLCAVIDRQRRQRRQQANEAMRAWAETTR